MRKKGRRRHSFPFAPIPKNLKNLWALMLNEAIYQMAVRISFVQVNGFTLEFRTDCKIEFTLRRAEPSIA